MDSNAADIFNLLIAQGIKTAYGEASFELLRLKATIEDKNPMGYLFQYWFKRWLDKNNIYNRENTNSQTFPDFYLARNSDTTNLLEMKIFDVDASANFDIANFEAYCRSLKTAAYRLDADYLIFAYSLHGGQFKIEDLWLKKIWEITGPSEAYPIRTQIKQGMIYNIRPINWCANSCKYKPFGTKENFVKALSKTLLKYSKTTGESKHWLEEICNNYKQTTGNLLFNEAVNKIF